MEYYNEFKKAYDSMPEFFSSFQFAKEARKNGVPSKVTEQGRGRDFLLNHTDAIQESSKTWQKNKPEKKQIKEDEKIKLSEAVKLLKEKGYRILKPTNEWIEL